MNKKHIWNIVITFSLLLIVSACKKNTEDPQPPEVVSKYCDILTKKADGKLSYNKEFTPDGKLSKYIYPSDSSYTSFIYKADSAYRFNYSYKTGTNVLQNSTAYKLNSDGNVISALTSDGNQYVYTYDNNGYCTQVLASSSAGTSITTYSYTDGNLSLSANSDYEVHFEYFMDKSNKVRSFGLNYGKPNKNLWKKESQTRIMSTGNKTVTFERTYDFDTDGLPITEELIFTSSAGVKDTNHFEYTYFCK